MKKLTHRPHALGSASMAWRSGWRVLAGVTGLAAALLAPGRGLAACQINALELPITLVGSRAVTTVNINGVEVRVLLDSGATFSFLTEAAARELNLNVVPVPDNLKFEGITGPIFLRKARVKRLKLQNGEMADVEFLVGGNEPGGGAQGLLGRNLLGFADTEYDLANGVVRLMMPKGDCGDQNMAYWAGQVPVSELALRRDSSRTLAPLEATGQLNGKSVQVVFDTGADTLVSREAARRTVAESELKPAGWVFGAGGGEAKSWVAPFHTFEIGGETIRNNQLRVADFNFDHIDMLLGLDFFLSHRIYVSKKQWRMFFTYNGGVVFDLNRAKADASAAASAPEPAGAVQPTDANGFARRAAAHASRKQFVQALADFDRACEMAPQEPSLFAQRGRLYQALERSPEALRDFDSALRLDPAQHSLRLERASLRARAGDRPGALDDLQTLDQRIAPEDSLRLAMARLYQDLDLLDRALPQLNSWIAAHKRDMMLAAALNDRCWDRTLLNVELDQAREDCEEVVRLHGQDPLAIDSRAWLHLRRAELNDALADFDRVLKIRPEHPSSLYGRGITRTRLGDAEQGRSDIDAARKLEASIDNKMGRYGLGADKMPADKPL